MASEDSGKVLVSLGSKLVQNVKRNKHSFFQFFTMTGLLLLSIRSAGQKYHIRELEEDTAALRKEQDSLMERMKKIKSSLLHEASLDSTGVFAARLRLLFGGDDQ